MSKPKDLEVASIKLRIVKITKSYIDLLNVIPFAQSTKPEAYHLQVQRERLSKFYIWVQAPHSTAAIVQKDKSLPYNVSLLSVMEKSLEIMEKRLDEAEPVVKRYSTKENRWIKRLWHGCLRWRDKKVLTDLEDVLGKHIAELMSVVYTT